MDALGVLLPLHVHVINVIGSVSGQEVVAGVGGGMRRIGGIGAAGRDGHGAASGRDFP